MKILLIVPDGVAIRNYLYSSFINELIEKDIEVIIYHNISEKAVLEIKSVQKFLNNFISIPLNIETNKARLLRESLCYARLLQNKKLLNNKTILSFWNGNRKGIKQKALYLLSELIGIFLSKSYKRVLKADEVYENEIKKSNNISKIEKHFDKLQPDFVLNLHQRAPLSAPIISVAKTRGIETGTVIFSWDNVPKARLISRYDKYFVWSDLMKDELKLLYPEIKNTAIRIVGTPQFEFYGQEQFYIEKKDFFNTFGLDIHKKTVCYSSNDTSLPYDPNYLEDICEEFMKLEKNKRPQIIFRICPVDKSDRFNKVLEKYKSIVYPIEPDWRTENKNSFTSIYPAFKDTELLINTVKHSDLVINMGSTMAHDFAVLDKPCLYLNYNPVKNPKIKVKDVYNFQHFKSMGNLDAVGWINSKEEILFKVKETLHKPKTTAKDRKKWLDRIVKYKNTSAIEFMNNLIN